MSESERGLINATQTSTYQLAFVCIQVLGMVFHDPCDFGVLVNISVGTVASAALIFTYWHFRSSATAAQLEESLLSNDFEDEDFEM